MLSADAGRAAYEAISHAVRDALAGSVDGVATAPVNKLAFSRAGLPWKGHTDLLGNLTGAGQARNDVLVGAAQSRARVGARSAREMSHSDHASGAR